MKQIVLLSAYAFRRKRMAELMAGLFIFLFMYTGINKLMHHAGFVSVLTASPLIGKKAVFISWALPVVELLASALLFHANTRRAGLICSLSLMVIFTAYVGYMIMTSAHLPCSCGGVLSNLTWRQHLEFNIVFTVLALAGVWMELKKQ